MIPFLYHYYLGTTGRPFTYKQYVILINICSRYYVYMYEEVDYSQCSH